MKPWHVTVIVALLAAAGFTAWLITSFRKGRDGR